MSIVKSKSAALTSSINKLSLTTQSAMQPLLCTQDAVEEKFQTYVWAGADKSEPREEDEGELSDMPELEMEGEDELSDVHEMEMEIGDELSDVHEVEMKNESLEMTAAIDLHGDSADAGVGFRNIEDIGTSNVGEMTQVQCADKVLEIGQTLCRNGSLKPGGQYHRGNGYGSGISGQNLDPRCATIAEYTKRLKKEDLNVSHNL